MFSTSNVLWSKSCLNFIASSVSPAVATEPVLPLLIHLERLEDEEEEVQEYMDEDDEETGQKKNLPKRNVSIDNYIAWGILQVKAFFPISTVWIIDI